MLYDSSDIPELKIFEDRSDEIIQEYKDYCDNVNFFVDAKDQGITRFTGYGTGKGLMVYNNKKSNYDNREHFPVLTKCFNDASTDTVIPWKVFFAILGPNSGVNLHNDSDVEFESKDGHEYRIIRSHVPVIIPEKCSFFHVKDKFKVVKWVPGTVFAFDKIDSHYTKNGSLEDRTIIEFDFYLKCQ